MAMDNMQYSDIESITKSHYDVIVSDTVCRWLQEKYNLKPSESTDLWFKVRSMIDDEVRKTYRNIIWNDTMENSHGYLYATNDSGETRLLGKIDKEIEDSDDATSARNDILEKRFRIPMTREGDERNDI